ncbi:MAG: apolipoprotein N-acyltransferase, partial [Verrucomicrobiota bacterium]
MTLHTKHPLLPPLAAILSGVLLGLCYPGADQSQLLWFWQFPLFFALWFWEPQSGEWPRRFPRWLWGGLIGWLSGFVFFLVSIVWMRHVTWPGYIVLSLYLGLYFGVWGSFASSLGRLSTAVIRPQDWKEKDQSAETVISSRLQVLLQEARKPNLLAPSYHTLWIAFLNASLWVTLEWLRGLVFTGFPWNSLGVALHGSTHLRQAADLVGVSGLAFLPVFFSAVMVSTIARFALEFGKGRLRPHLDFSVALVLLILTFFYGVHTVQNHRVEDPITLRALLVQGNISIEQRYDLDPDNPQSEIWEIYDNLTNLYADQNYDLIVWPETCIPATFFEADTFRYLNSILARGDFYLLTGIEQVILQQDEDAEVYNSMVLMRKEAYSYQDYQKIHRVPFGEYIPFRHSFPIFAWALGNLIPEDFDPGLSRERLALTEPSLQIIPSICFEDSLGRLPRRFLQDGPQGAQLIVNLTNDAWFQQSHANAQHLAHAKFRCIELKRPMLRCANTG